MAILDVKRLELAKSQLTTEQIFKIKREKFKNEIIEIKNTEKPEKESELKLNTREDIDQLIGQLVIQLLVELIGLFQQSPVDNNI